MAINYMVGLANGTSAGHVSVEAEDALIAALRVKSRHPEAAITYVRKRNERGDRRHPEDRVEAETA